MNATRMAGETWPRWFQIRPRLARCLDFPWRLTRGKLLLARQAIELMEIFLAAPLFSRATQVDGRLTPRCLVHLEVADGLATRSP